MHVVLLKLLQEIQSLLGLSSEPCVRSVSGPKKEWLETVNSKDNVVEDGKAKECGICSLKVHCHHSIALVKRQVGLSSLVHQIQLSVRRLIIVLDANHRGVICKL